jgi:hypothetical protein
MPAYTNNFDSYKIWFYSAHPYEALIYLYNATKYVGRLVFYKDGTALPTNGYASPFGTPELSVNFHIGKFSDIIEILREEKPLYLALNTDNGIGTLATADYEAVGQEEGV